MTDESTSAPSTMDDLFDLPDQQVNQQMIVRLVLTSCSASLSVIGSTAIVLKIVRGFRSMTPYDRIVLGMSTCDILASIHLATTDFLVPRETQWTWALGNEATCQASAAFGIFVGWALWYNAMLSLYFLLMVLSQVRQKDYVRKFELWMHLVGLLWCPIIATMGLFLGWYGVAVGGYCTITDLEILFNFYLIPMFLLWLLIIVDYSLICAVVRKSLQSNNDSQMRLKKETTTLMILYVGSIFVVFGPWTVHIFLQINSYTRRSEIYPLLVLEYITFPLQGFLSAFIYFKPAYTRFRAANPNKPIRFVLHQALFNRTAPKSNHHHRNAQHVTHGSAYGHNITDISLTDPSSTDPSAANAIAEDDVGVGITGIDFETRLFFVEEDAAAENNISPLGVAEENDDAPDSNL